jgi:hypothetical protein
VISYTITWDIIRFFSSSRAACKSAGACFSYLLCFAPSFLLSPNFFFLSTLICLAERASQTRATPPHSHTLVNNLYRFKDSLVHWPPLRPHDSSLLQICTHGEAHGGHSYPSFQGVCATARVRPPLPAPLVAVEIAQAICPCLGRGPRGPGSFKIAGRRLAKRRTKRRTSDVWNRLNFKLTNDIVRQEMVHTISYTICTYDIVQIRTYNVRYRVRYV